MKILKNWGLDQAVYGRGDYYRAFSLIAGNFCGALALTSGARLINYLLFVGGSRVFIPNGLEVQFYAFLLYFILELALLGYAYWKSPQGNLLFVSSCFAVGIASLFVFLSAVVIDMLTLLKIDHPTENLLDYGIFFSKMLFAYFTHFSMLFIFPLAAFLLSLMLRGTTLKRTMNPTERSTYGSALFASKEDCVEMGLYDDKGALFGKDEQGRYLRYPLCNRLIIAPPGTFKSAGAVIPALLTENRSTLVHDVKGELHAVTARHRMETFKRKVVAIDPFGVTRQKSYAANKPPELLEEFTLNLLEYIPTDPENRDRAITSLVRSMVARESGGNSLHWEENSKLFIGGLIDYVLKVEAAPSLLDVHDLMLMDLKEMNEFLEVHMMNSGGRAQSAAAQLLKTAKEERGSIFTTTYRQLKWLSDVNMRNTFEASNFDLTEFITGSMDIYVVMPEDQVSEQSRVIRMIVSVLTSMIVRLDPSELPKSKILFIFDELGQLEYCDDVEKMIEVLRARGVIIWGIFQALSQVKLYKKYDLFLNMEMRQFFRVDDPDTMKMIQQLGGKKTILQENISENTGSSTQSSRFSTSRSKGEGTSYHEVGVDLIHINEIREMDADSQYVFISGKKPIACKKTPYFREPLFDGLYDPNPLETNRT